MIEMMIILAIFVGIAAYATYEISRRQKRRKTLHQSDSGMWIWTDFDGSTKCSEQKPDRPGGDWYPSRGDSGGFDWGGDGDGGGGD